MWTVTLPPLAETDSTLVRVVMTEASGPNLRRADPITHGQTRAGMERNYRRCPTHEQAPRVGNSTSGRNGRCRVSPPPGIRVLSRIGK